MVVIPRLIRKKRVYMKREIRLLSVYTRRKNIRERHGHCGERRERNEERSTYEGE